MLLENIKHQNFLKGLPHTDYSLDYYTFPSPSFLPV